LIGEGSISGVGLIPINLYSIIAVFDSIIINLKEEITPLNATGFFKFVILNFIYEFIGQYAFDPLQNSDIVI
jgi:hypothetical protein